MNDQTRSRAEALQWGRSLLEAAMTQAEPGQMASLHKEYRATLAELEQFAPAIVSTSDDLVDRRAARRAGTAGAASTAVGR